MSTIDLVAKLVEMGLTVEIGPNDETGIGYVVSLFDPINSLRKDHHLRGAFRSRAKK